MDQVSLVYLPDSSCETNGQTQKFLHFHRPLDQAIEKLVGTVLKQEYRLGIARDKVKGRTAQPPSNSFLSEYM